MNSPIDPALIMPDVQSSLDTRQIAIQRVGIRGVRHPFVIATEDGEALPTIANWSLTVALPAEQKGTHMSRFVALLEKHRRTPVDIASFGCIAQEMLVLLQAERGELIASFPYFINKTAPISGMQSLMDYEVQWLARAEADSVLTEVTVTVPVTSLCPCSKTISDYGAHNQRSHVTVRATLDASEPFTMDGLIRAIEAEGSCELWGMLKRTDEKFVTERAYDNPKFVEDLVRDVAARVAVFPGVASYVVEAENFESIHNHSAYAVVEG